MCIFNKFLRKLADLSPRIIGPKNYHVNSYDVIIKHNILIRVYESTNKLDTNPIMLYLHGGGFVIGSIKCYDRILKYISYHTNCTMIAIEYKKSPENKFPIPLIDSYRGYKWVIKNFFKSNNIPRKLIFCGDSAGGNLSIGLLKLISKSKNKNLILPDLLILIYPLLEGKIRSTSNKLIKTIINKISELVLIYSLKNYFTNKREYDSQYFSHINHLDISGSNDLICLDNTQEIPTKFKNSVNNSKIFYPTTYIIKAELDSLTSSINEYIHKLESIGVKVYHKEYLNTLHGFINFAGVTKEGDKALQDITNIVNSLK